MHAGEKRLKVLPSNFCGSFLFRKGSVSSKFGLFEFFLKTRLNK